MKSRTLAKAAGAVSLATLISRILGLIREVVIAKYFRVFATDAFFAAYRIPNMLRDLFAEGALSAAFIPTFTQYKQNRSPQEAWRLANNILNVLTIVLSIITLIILFGAKFFVYLLVSGYSQVPGKIELTVELTRIMSPFLMTVALAAAVMGILNTHGRFFIPAVAPAFYNLFAILAGIFLSPFMPRFGQDPVVAMAIGSLLGGAAQLYAQIPSLYKTGYRYQFVIDWKHPGLRRIFTLMVPATFGLAATQINILIDNQLASYLGNGPVSWLNYAFRLMQLPIGLFGVAIATVNLANVSKKVAANDLEGVKSDLAAAMKLAAFLNIPATFGLIFLRYPIVELIYERGRFTAEHTIQTGDALLFYSIGLYTYSLVKILTPTFYALGDTKTPVRAAVAVILVKIVINLLLIRPFGFLGLAFGTSIASILNTGILYWSLKKKLGDIHSRDLALSFFKILIASIIMGLAAMFAHTQISSILGNATLYQKTANVGISISIALAVLFLVSYLLRTEEARDILALMRRKLGLHRKDAEKN